MIQGVVIHRITVREYARIQTFPDDWSFCDSTMSQYKQIGNAVPVNLAEALGRSLIMMLNSIDVVQRAISVREVPASYSVQSEKKGSKERKGLRQRKK